MVAARSRIRGKAEAAETPAPRKPGNPYMLIAVMVGLIGIVLVIVALIFYFDKKKKRDKRIKMIRGIVLLDKLDDLACDYFYNKKEGPLPEEAWAPFIAEANKHGDVVDAVITLSKGAIDEFVDAARYKQGMKWGMKGRGEFYGPKGSDKNASRAQVQVLKGHVEIGKRGARVFFFRRPILVPGKGTDWEYGKATIIILRDVPSPLPESYDIKVNALPMPKEKASGDGADTKKTPPK
jgi:hypothetical protein